MIENDIFRKSFIFDLRNAAGLIGGLNIFVFLISIQDFLVKSLPFDILHLISKLGSRLWPMDI